MFTLVAATLDPMDATVSIQFYKKNKIGYTKKKNGRDLNFLIIITTIICRV